jgi:DNA-binding NarL/FixJ family response regulator
VQLALNAPDDLGRHRNPFFMLSMTLSEADRFDEAADACRQAAEECRTQAVAKLVAQGLTNREVAQRLYISPHTVNTQVIDFRSEPVTAGA